MDKAQSINKRIVKASSVVFLMMLGNIVFGFVIRVILAKRLSIEEFGLYYALFAFLGLIGMLKNFGLNNALIKFIPQFLINNEKDKVKTSILFTLFFSITSSIIIAIVIYHYSDGIAHNYFHYPEAGEALNIFLLFFIISLLASTLNNVFNAFQRPFLLSYGGLLANFIICMLILTSRQLDIIRVSWYVIAAYFAVLIFNTIFLFRIFNVFKFPASPLMPVAQKLFKFGFASTASSITGHLSGRLDTIVLTVTQNLGYVGVYNALIPFARIFKVFGSSISKILFPITSELYEKGEIGEIRRILFMVHKYLYVLLIPIAVILITYAEYILEILFGREFVPGANAARVIIVSAMMSPISIINISAINGLGFPFKNTIVVSISSATLIVSNIIFIPLWGYNGAAMAYFMEKIVTFVSTHFYLKKLINYQPKILQIGKAVFFGFFMCCLMLLTSVYYTEILQGKKLFGAIFITLFGLLFYAAVCLLFKVIRIDEIKHLIRFIAQKR